MKSEEAPTLEDEFAANQANVRAYYDATWLDYRLFWMNRKNCALHFGYWDEDTHGHAESLVNMNRALARRIDIRPGQRILDAGCGVGGSAFWLAKTYNAEVVGVTLVGSQVDRARRYARQHGVEDQVTFVQQDYTSTTFDDASFDVVWAMQSLCHAPNKKRFLREARRVLRPGGKLAIDDYLRTDRQTDDEDQELLQSWLASWAIPNLATGPELAEWCEQAGFVDVQLEDVTDHVLPSLARLHRLVTWGRPIGILLHWANLRTELRRGNSRGARAQYEAVVRGLWFEGMLSAVAG